VEKALSLDPTDAGPHAVSSHILLLKGRHEQAVDEGRKALALSASSVEGYGALGMSLCYAGRCEEALGIYEKAVRLDPVLPAWLLHNMGNAYLMLGRYEEAIASNQKALLRSPDSLLAYLGLAAAYSLSGCRRRKRSMQANGS
jgi:adenylate cyclase